jgi:hypothetical protein
VKQQAWNLRRWWRRRNHGILSAAAAVSRRSGLLCSKPLRTSNSSSDSVSSENASHRHPVSPAYHSRRLAACSVQMVMSWLITWDQAWPLGQKGRQMVGKVGEWYVKSRHLQDCSPHLCQLSTDGLAPTSKYWTYRSHASDMGLVSLVAYHR